MKDLKVATVFVVQRERKAVWEIQVREVPLVLLEQPGPLEPLEPPVFEDLREQLE